jgi:hypothetical protein
MNDEQNRKPKIQRSSFFLPGAQAAVSKHPSGWDYIFRK